MLKVIYTDVKDCVRPDNTLSDCFECLSEVKQGEPSSQLLFIRFINDCYESPITQRITILIKFIVYLLQYMGSDSKYYLNRCYGM